jgi:hypothetical protein
MIEMNSIDKQDIKNELFTLTALFRDHLNSSKVLSQTSLDIVSYINDYIQLFVQIYLNMTLQSLWMNTKDLN